MVDTMSKLCINCDWNVRMPFSISYCSRPRYAPDLSQLDDIIITAERAWPSDGQRCGPEARLFKPMVKVRAA